MKKPNIVMGVCDRLKINGDIDVLVSFKLDIRRIFLVDDMILVFFN